MSDEPLQSLVNGKQAETISIRDRGFLYGDGCFETIRIVDNRAVLLAAHLERLQQACTLLALALDLDLLEREVELALNSRELPSAVLKIIITRGEGGRGYTPPSASEPSRIVQLFDYTQGELHRGARAVLCDHRLSSNSQLAGVKHLNRLDQVLASAQIPEGFQEGLCLDQDGQLIEGCRSNLLLGFGDELISPDLKSCGVEGIMLNHLIAELGKLGATVTRTSIALERLREATELYLCNSVFGVWAVSELKTEHGMLSWNPSKARYGEAIMNISNGLFIRANH